MIRNAYECDLCHKQIISDNAPNEWFAVWARSINELANITVERWLICNDCIKGIGIPESGVK